MSMTAAGSMAVPCRRRSLITPTESTPPIAGYGLTRPGRAIESPRKPIAGRRLLLVVLVEDRLSTGRGHPCLDDPGEDCVAVLKCFGREVEPHEVTGDPTRPDE